MMKNDNELKNFTITMSSGTKFGGKHRDAAEARQVNSLFGKVVKVEQRHLFTPEESAEMDSDKAWHRAH